jgi:oligoribonuclease (3'-5' exoribonuclease)
VSEELEITGLDAEEEYILYVQAFVGSEAISVIVEYSFTTIIGVVPIVNFTQISFDNVRFTIENEEDFEITVKYELNTPPTVDSVVIDANDISEELEITGLDEEEEYILYVQTFVNSEAISGIVEYPFTTTVQFGGGL